MVNEAGSEHGNGGAGRADGIRSMRFVNVAVCVLIDEIVL